MLFSRMFWKKVSTCAAGSRQRRHEPERARSGPLVAPAWLPARRLPWRCAAGPRATGRGRACTPPPAPLTPGCGARASVPARTRAHSRRRSRLGRLVGEPRPRRRRERALRPPLAQVGDAAFARLRVGQRDGRRRRVDAHLGDARAAARRAGGRALRPPGRNALAGLPTRPVIRYNSRQRPASAAPPFQRGAPRRHAPRRRRCNCTQLCLRTTKARFPAVSAFVFWPLGCKPAARAVMAAPTDWRQSFRADERTAVQAKLCVRAPAARSRATCAAAAHSARTRCAAHAHTRFSTARRALVRARSRRNLAAALGTPVLLLAV